MKRLVLIDGNAILHRAYHALPPLTAPDGSLVNAVYGFTSMLLKLFADLKPDYLAVAFDRPKPTFRKEIYKEYQAKRPKMDEELISQIEKVHEVVRAFGVPIYEVDGYEADDVIGTIARSVPKDKVDQIIIVTGDHDLLQLVDEHTFIYMLLRGLTEAKLYDTSEVKEKLGIAPKLIPDYKAIAGDASDNYPGVPGVGPKTAAQLLTAFGSLAKLYQNLKKKEATEKISESLREKLEQGKESATVSKDLATIRTGVPLQLVTSAMKVGELDRPQARQILEELNFKSLLKRLANGQNNTKKTASQAKKTKKENKDSDNAQQQLF